VYFDGAESQPRSARHPRSHRADRTYHARGKTFADFENSWELRWLVQRAIEIISEASRAIPDEMKNTRPEIPWPRVRGIGNVLRHDYAAISDPIIWKMVTDEFPPLKQAIIAIADQLDE
jgi:uncharacterized protein with HEPN domain